MGASQRGHRAAGCGVGGNGTVRRWVPPRRPAWPPRAMATSRPPSLLQSSSTSAVAHGVILRRRLSAGLRPPELYLCAAAGVVSAGGFSALG
ncbi:unnamed protein product, partial [Bubo scandiacus]